MKDILTYMSPSASLLDQVCAVQSANSTLSGDDLRMAGRKVASLAAREGCLLMAVDAAGERLIAAAILADDAVRTADTSCRLDDQWVLLVAGHLAGSTGIALKADLARALGAAYVQATFLGDEHLSVHGCDRVTSLTLRPPFVAL